MSEQSEIKALRAELIEVQTQLAFQENVVGELNDSLAQQQRDIASLKRVLELLKQQYLDIHEQLPGADAASEKPPHY